jgi:hypothetical protein
MPSTGGPAWKKARASGTQDCVEVAVVDDDDVLVRHSKAPQGPVLRFTSTEWKAFIAGVEAGEFTLPG